MACSILENFGFEPLTAPKYLRDVTLPSFGLPLDAIGTKQDTVVYKIMLSG